MGPETHILILEDPETDEMYEVILSQRLHQSSCCNKCGYLYKFEELAKHVKEKHPSVNIKGREGRRGSFEVTINETLVHSKLSTLAYPDYDDLSKIVTEAQEGKPIRTSCKQQPITNCVIT